MLTIRRRIVYAERGGLRSAGGMFPTRRGRGVYYLVYIQIERSRAKEWHRWMCEEHIPDVMDTGCFSHAALLRGEASDSPQRIGFRVMYRARSTADYERYQREHAKTLQADHTARFEGAFDASRELLPVLADFPSTETG